MKRYGQYCPVAHALDQVGDRWALLIVRELMLGQRRFTDLAEALPGIGSNILSTRLRTLEASGVVRKRKLAPPLAVTVYELTEQGHALDGVLAALAQWGATTLGAPLASDCWSMYAVHARFRPEAAVDGVYEIRFGEDGAISLEVADRVLTARPFAAESPTLAVELESETLHALIEGQLSVRRAVSEGRAQLAIGSQNELAALVGMFAPDEARAASGVAA